jgi:hypothetical protein
MAEQQSMHDELMAIASRLGFASQDQSAHELRKTVWDSAQKILNIAMSLGGVEEYLSGRRRDF